VGANMRPEKRKGPGALASQVLSATLVPCSLSKFYASLPALSTPPRAHCYTANAPGFRPRAPGLRAAIDTPAFPSIAEGSHGGTETTEKGGIPPAPIPLRPP